MYYVVIIFSMHRTFLTFPSLSSFLFEKENVQEKNHLLKLNEMKEKVRFQMTLFCP